MHVADVPHDLRVALYGLGPDTKFGAAGLVMAIIGGAIVVPIQGFLTDRIGAAHALVVLKACFICVLTYALYDLKQKPRVSEGEAAPIIMGEALPRRDPARPERASSAWRSPDSVPRDAPCLAP